jgi:hypothetical protein
MTGFGGIAELSARRGRGLRLSHIHERAAADVGPAAAVDIRARLRYDRFLPGFGSLL